MEHAAAGSGHLETSTGLDNRKLLMWLFLGSECLFFGSLIAAYLLYRDRSLGPPFPSDRVFNGVHYEGLFDIPFTSVSAFVLLMSSVTMVLALAAIQRGNRRSMQVWLLTTALLGTLFVSGQAYEFTVFHREGLSLGSNLFGTTFFVLTGFHGAHVTIGVLILLSLLAMSFQGRIQQKDSLNVELAGLYWHFVDVVWIVIFTLVYLIQP
ncbi:MAG: heme-copper oxidase subunit III [Dehalococcoidia bacterium]|nr:heme-copper oxidase subunit III [Dehalococcoidia bacterium]